VRRSKIDRNDKRNQPGTETKAATGTSRTSRDGNGNEEGNLQGGRRRGGANNGKGEDNSNGETGWQMQKENNTTGCTEGLLQEKE